MFAIAIMTTIFICSFTSRTRLFYLLKPFVALVAMFIVMMIAELSIWFLEGNPANATLIRICCLTIMLCAGTIGSLYSACLYNMARIRKHYSSLPTKVIVFFNFALCAFVICLSGTDLIFYVDEFGYYQSGPYYAVIELSIVAGLLIDTLLVFYYRESLPLRNMINLLIFAISPICAVLLAPIWYPAPVYMAFTISCFLLYNMFVSELTDRFNETEKQLAEIEKTLAENRISTMMSQIQPHFIYNTLGTVEYLCKTNPEEAAELVHDFTLYLRGNFTELDSINVVSLGQEIKHVEHYVNIEKKRFPDIEVIYDLKANGFYLPALSIQPLVENSIKHGLMGLESGGTVTISTYETDKYYGVSVSDNGVGFNVEEIYADKNKHIGISNVKERIELLTKGTLGIKSEINKGTIAEILIPKSGGVTNESDSCR